MPEGTTLPEPLRRLLEDTAWENLSWSAGLVVATMLFGLLLHRVVFAALRRWTRKSPTDLDDAVVHHLRRPLSVTVPLLLLVVVLPVVPLGDEAVATLRQVHTLSLIGAVTWLVLRAIRVVETVLLSRYDLSAKDNLAARATVTQMKVFKNVSTFLVLVIGVGIALLSFPAVHKLGASLLASAGVAGVVIGFAAQKSIATLIAGVQIAITQPIRIDDVVIVEKEWGRIEEITLTYVVVRIWDLRRLVVPITYFIDKPFQNWTRTSARLLGAVSIWTDYTVPMDEMRAAYRRILEESGMWDGEVEVLQVVDATERTIEVRALLSAPDSQVAWDLRCYVREALLEWLREHHPESLPQTRVELDERPAA